MAAALFLLGCARRRLLGGFHRNLNRGFSTTHPTQQPPLIEPDPEEWEHWESFKTWRLEYDKNYGSEHETLYRYEIYCESKKEVETLNKEGTEFKYALNFFADISTSDLPPAYRVGMIRFRMPRSILF